MYLRGMSVWSEATNSDLEWSFKSGMANNANLAGDNPATTVIVENDIDEMDNEPYTQSGASHNLYMFPPTLKRDIACFPASIVPRHCQCRG